MHHKGFLPKVVKVKLNDGKPERSQLKAAGFFDVGPGNRAGQGRRMGFAYFVAYVDLLLDEDVEVDVEVGQRVSAGESVLASFALR